ncbi:hypothetical protein, partial [Mesorhizobium sp. M2A.F.Ca.ET.039.01.1.1]|uniref:hypothetical protein n=1 Tax=Mesorhizobium sp. M2A.F.Ca.ET.039.01.1.1 TaxID=2496746 RepID=UPI0016747799
NTRHRRAYGPAFQGRIVCHRDIRWLACAAPGQCRQQIVTRGKRIGKLLGPLGIAERHQHRQPVG